MAGQTKRINRGRGHSYKLDGEKTEGVTGIINKGIPKPALVGWAAGSVGEFVADRLHEEDGRIAADELVQELRKVNAESKYPKKWDGSFSRMTIAQVLKGIPYLDRDRAGNRGTEVHRFAERIAAGEEVQVPDELIGHVDSYLAFLSDFDPEVRFLETVVGNREWGYMGTLDSIMEIDGYGLVQVDLKTNRSGPFGEVGLQLAAYERAEFYLDGEGEQHPCWEVDGEVRELDGSYVLWLRADGYDLKPVETSDRVFRLFLYAQQVSRFVDGWSRDVVGESVRPISSEQGAT